MTNKSSKIRCLKEISLALKIAAIYFILGALWILLSNKILGVLVRDSTLLMNVSIVKGWFYVSVSALVLYVLISRDVSQIERSEKEARLNHAKYMELVESANSIIMRRDISGQITFLNKFAQNFFGYRKDEILGKNVIGTIVPEVERSGRDLKAMIEDMGKRPERYTNCENENMRANGDRVWIAWTNKPIRDEHGRFTEMLCIGNDITERKLAEEAKKESEERLEVLAKATFEGIAFIDGSVVIDANPQLAQMHQYDLSELIGKPLADLVAPEGRELARQNVEAGYEGRYQNRLLRKDGSTIVVETQAKHFEYRGRTIRVSVVRDISERKRAEEAVAREAKLEVQLAQTLEITGAMIWEYRFHEQEYWLDKTACKMLGIEPEDMPISRKIWVERFLHPDDLRNSESVFSRLISGENLAAEIRHRYKNQKTGEWRWVHAHAAVSEKDADGRALRLVGTAMDFTDSHRLEEQLAQSQKLEAIGTLAGGIAHDFNNILAAIIGYSEILTLFHIPKDSPARPDLDQVLRAAYRAKDLVGQILILSRKTELEKKPVLVSPIVREALKFLRSTLPATIEIRQSIESDMGKVLADATQIHQVVMNLCTNAGHAMAERGGVLGIRLDEADLDAPAAEKFQDLDPGPYLRLVVTDTGIGMNRATLERIFEPYFTTKEQGAGTGLGLAVTHGIIKNHRGAITVESEPGKGATFEVLLPRLAAEPVEFANDVSLSIPGGNEHVLFIDDEEALVNMAQSSLGNLGYSVIVETGGNKALEVFRSNPESFDIVITDLTMPGMTGIELAERLKSVRPEIPIILCSGSIDESLREKAKSLGINDFLPKPVGVHALAEAVRRVLDKTSEES